MNFLSYVMAPNPEDKKKESKSSNLIDTPVSSPPMEEERG
jgi:hypothetical protein